MFMSELLHEKFSFKVACRAASWQLERLHYVTELLNDATALEPTGKGTADNPFHK